VTIATADTVVPAVDTVQPWPGLDAFTEALSRFFCGRDTEADELFRHVQRDVVTVLFGQSGLGKTSLLQAGLFPRLRTAGFLPILIRFDYSVGAPPPVGQVKAAMERECTAAKLSVAIWATMEESLWGCFHRADRRLTDRAGKELVPVLVFDQFEEIFTQGLAGSESRAASQRFITELAELVENRPPEILEHAIEADPEIVERFRFDRRDYRIVLALREDYLAALEGLRTRAPSLGRNRYRLRRMTGAQGLDAILNPVPGLVDYDAAQEIIRFVGRPNPEYAIGATGGEAAEGFEVEPSLLSLVCRELNERRLAQGLHEINADLLAGSRDDIIERFYERCFAGQPAPLRAFVEDKLLSANGFRESVALDTAQRALHESGVPVAALDELVRRRLLRIEERFDVARVEIIHDVLTTVICKSRDTRRLRQAEESAAVREAELRRERRNSHRARLVAATMGALALVTIGLALWGWRSSNEADRSRRLAEKRTEEVARIQLLAAGAMLESADLERVGDHAIKSLKEYREKLENFAVTAPNDIDRQRELAVNDFTIALLKLFSRKDDDSLNEFQKYYAVTAQLASLRPTDQSLQRDLAASHAVLGVIFEGQSEKGPEHKNENLTSALTEYLGSSVILSRLSSNDTGDLALTHEFAVSHVRIGSVLSKQGDLSGALREWRAYESIMLPLVDEHQNADWRSEFAGMRDQMGDALQATGDLDGAVEEWRSYEDILRKVSKEDSTNLGNSDALAKSYKKVGDTLVAASKYEQALAFYKNGLAIREQLSAAQPKDFQSQEEVVSSLQKIGDAMSVIGQHEEALAAFQKIRSLRETQSLASRERVAHAPEDLWELGILSGSLSRLALARRQVGDISGAVAAGKEQVSIARKLYAAPNVSAKDELAGALGSLAYDLLLNHQVQNAAVLTEESIKLDPSAVWIKLNRAHAYLFLGRFDDAKHVYLEIKGEPLRDGLTFAQAIKDDFSEFRKNGINTPEMAEMEALLLR
jgi:tetratricopeptide (TPR) repeat protein